MTATLTTNYTTKCFEVHIDGQLLFASKTRAAAVEVFLAHGGVLDTPKPMSRSAARRMEATGRGNSGGWGVSRSGRR